MKLRSQNQQSLVVVTKSEDSNCIEEHYFKNESELSNANQFLHSNANEICALYAPPSLSNNTPSAVTQQISVSSTAVTTTETSIQNLQCQIEIGIHLGPFVYDNISADHICTKCGSVWKQDQKALPSSLAQNSYESALTHLSFMNDGLLICNPHQSSYGDRFFQTKCTPHTSPSTTPTTTQTNGSKNINNGLSISLTSIPYLCPSTLLNKKPKKPQKSLTNVLVPPIQDNCNENSAIQWVSSVDLKEDDNNLSHHEHALTDEVETHSKKRKRRAIEIAESLDESETLQTLLNKRKKPSASIYDPLAYFEAYVDHREATDKPLDSVIIDDILHECQRRGIIVSDETPDITFRTVMKYLNYNKLYPFIPQIRARITGNPPPRLSSDERTLLMEQMKIVNQNWKQIVAHTSRKSMVRHSVLYDYLCELNNFKSYSSVSQCELREKVMVNKVKLFDIRTKILDPAVENHLIPRFRLIDDDNKVEDEEDQDKE